MHEWTMEDTLIAITAITSIGILIQACVAIGLFLSARKAMVLVTKFVGDAREHVMPVLATSRHLVEDISPKIKVIATNLTEVSHTVRNQTEHVNATVGEVVDRTRHQAARMDGMVTGTLNGIDSATANLQEGIAVPIRKVQGIFNGVRAGLESLRQRPRTNHTKADNDLFV